MKLLFISDDAANIIGSGLAELPGKVCIPVLNDLNKQTDDAIANPGAFVARVDEYLAPVRAMLAAEAATIAKAAAMKADAERERANTYPEPIR